jgi:hypothetical protein
VAEYDGIIRINTEIDTDNAVTDSKELINAMKQLQNELSKMSKEISTAFNDFDTTKMQNETKKATKSTKQATKDISADVTKLQLDIAKWENEIAKIEEAYANLDPSIDDASLRRMLQNNQLWYQYLELIDDAERKIQNLKTPPAPKVQELESAKKEPTVVDSGMKKNTEILKDNTDETSDNGKQRNKLISGMQSSISVIKKMNQAFLKGTKGFSNFSKSIKNNDGAVQKLGKSFKNLGRSIGTILLYAALFSAVTKINEAINVLVKTNSQFSASLAQIKGNLLTAFMPIYQAIIPAINAMLSSLVLLTGYLAQFTSQLFGKSVKSSQKSAESLYNQATAYDKLGKSAKKANKSISDNLQSFDELNMAQKDVAENTPDLAGATDLSVPIEPTFNEISLSDNVTTFIEELRKAFESGDFTDIGIAIGTKVNEAMNSIDWEQAKSGAEKAGRSIATLLNGIILATDWELLGTTMAQGLNTAVTGIKAFADSFDFLAGGTSIADTINGFFTGIDWQLINDTGIELGKGIAEIANGFISVDWIEVGSGLSSAINTIFTSIGTFISTFNWSDLGTGIADGLNSIFTGIDFKDVGKTLSDGVKGVLDAVTSFLFSFDFGQVSKGLVDIVLGIDWLGLIVDGLLLIIGAGKALYDFQKGFSDAVSEAVLNGLEYGLKKIGDGIEFIKKILYKPLTNAIITLFKIRNGISGIFSDFGKSFINGIKDFFKWENLKARIESVFTSLKNVFARSHPIFYNFAKLMINGIKDYFKWDNLKDRIHSVWTSIKNVFLNARSSFKTVGKNIIDGIKENLTVDKLKNALTKPFKGAINAVIALFNSMIEAVNKSLKFTWDAIKVAGKTIVPSGSVTIAKLPKIPKLATGMAIPANYGEFQAILGDSREPEVVSPISMMKQAFKEAMMESGGNNGNGVIHNYMVLDGKIVSESVFNYGKKYKNQTGRNPI